MVMGFLVFLQNRGGILGAAYQEIERGISSLTVIRKALSNQTDRLHIVCHPEHFMNVAERDRLYRRNM